MKKCNTCAWFCHTDGKCYGNNFLLYGYEVGYTLISPAEGGKCKNWTFDLRWNYGSGFPFTKTKGLYPDIAYVDITGDYIHANEGLGIALDSLNGGQLPDYHRLDISLKRKFYISETCNMDLGIGVSNVYNYANVFYVNRNNDIIYQLPILWSLSYSVTF